MRSLLRILILALLPLWAGCGKHRIVASSPPSPPPAANTMEPGCFIVKPGETHFDDGRIVYTMKVEADTKLHPKLQCQIKDSFGGMGSWDPMPLASPSAPWFVYMETPERYWIFNGGDQLFLMSVSGKGPFSFLYQRVLGETGINEHVGHTPTEVILKLPPELKKHYPAAPATPPRPSI